MIIKEMLEANRRFSRESGIKTFEAKKPRKSLVILTCMDHRLVDFLEPALGIARGDAAVIKNAGNTVAGENNDVLRSLLVALYLLECKEIVVVGHTGCGMKKTNTGQFKEKMLQAGIKEQNIENLELDNWLGSFESEKGNIIDTVERLRNSKYIAKEVPIHGLLLDLGTGSAEHLVTV